MIVVIEIGRDRVVGDKQVRPAVVVVVGPDHPEAVITDVVVDTGLLRNLLKGAVAAVAVEKVAFAHESPGAALHEHAFVATVLVAPKLRQMIHVHVRIARDEQIHVAVAIVIAPRRTGAEPAAADSGLLGRVFESAVPQIVVQHIAAVAGHKQIQFAVVVVVGDGHAHPPTQARQTGLLGDVFKVAVRFLVIERHHRIAALAEPLDRRSVRHHDVQAPIVITVEQPHAPTHGFQDVPLFPRGDVRSRQPHFVRNIFEDGNRREAAAVRFGPGHARRWLGHGNAGGLEGVRLRRQRDCGHRTKN